MSHPKPSSCWHFYFIPLELRYLLGRYNMTQYTPLPPVIGTFIIHSIVVKLITSHILSQIYNTTLVMLVYDRDTMLQVVQNRGHGFQKDLPCRGAQIATHTRSTSEKPTQNPTRHSRQSDHRIHKIFQEATPLSYPQRSWPAPRRTQGFCGRL